MYMSILESIEGLARCEDLTVGQTLQVTRTDNVFLRVPFLVGLVTLIVFLRNTFRGTRSKLVNKLAERNQKIVWNPVQKRTL